MKGQTKANTIQQQTERNNKQTKKQTIKKAANAYKYNKTWKDNNKKANKNKNKTSKNNKFKENKQT